MLFNEIYSCYFNTVAEILKEAVNETLTSKKMTTIIQEKAFQESHLIRNMLLGGEWALLNKNLKTPLKHTPTQPLTILQKRWMKSLLLDPRIQLFNPSYEGLEDVRPLYTPDTFVWYDRFTDSDPYQNKSYIQNFRTVLQALEEKNALHITYCGRTGLEHENIGIPVSIEYSAKNDKFRLLIYLIDGMYQNISEINIARINTCFLCECPKNITIPNSPPKECVVLKLKDERNAMERAMLQFSYFEKETVQLDELHYRMTIYYNKMEETELLIQILSFGAMMTVIEPTSFRQKLKDRLKKQISLMIH